MRFNLRENLPLKVFALLLAVLCWIVVRSEEDRVKDFLVPVDYVNLPQNLELSGRLIDTVTVRVRASEAVLRTITDDRFSAPIDLSHAPLGEQHVQITEAMIRTPPGAEVMRITPALIPILIEKRVTREVPVVAEFAGQPAAGYRKVGYTIDPPVVTIVGPTSEVSQIEQARTGTIFLEGATRDLSVDVRPIPDGPTVSRARILAPRGPVRVRVTIEPEATESDTAADESAGEPESVQ